MSYSRSKEGRESKESKEGNFVKITKEIELLQVALGCRKELSRVPTDKEWAELFQFAEEHSVIGLMFAGVERLPKPQLPDMDLLMDWLGQTEYLKSQKDVHDEVICEFAQLMEREGITYVVFKGLAAASKYRTFSNHSEHSEPFRTSEVRDLSNLRTLGDIDFYVAQKDFDRCVEVIEREWGEMQEKDRKDKHFAFDRKGIRMEMHYSIETFGRQKHQQYFDALVEQYVSLGNASFEVAGVQVPMLQPMMDLIVVMKHWFNHLLGEGVGLRQTTDLAVLIGAYRKRIDVRALKEHLRNIGYLRAMDAVVALVERYYGIEWPEYWNSGESLEFRGERLGHETALHYADKLMADVMRNGNFGRSDYKHKDGWRKRLETTTRFFSHCWRYYKLAPKDIRCLVPKRIAISLRAH